MFEPYGPPPEPGASAPELWGSEDRVREQFGDRLNTSVCNEMLAVLRLPHDQTRMVAGVPTTGSIEGKPKLGKC